MLFNVGDRFAQCKENLKIMSMGLGVVL